MTEHRMEVAHQDPAVKTTATSSKPAHKSSALSTFISTMVVCGLLIAGAWSLLTSQHHVEEHSTRTMKNVDPVSVTVAEVTPRRVQRSVSVVGSLYGQEEITIRPKVGGRVVEIAHETGDRVRTGDVLLKVERTDYELAVGEARRSLELELTRLGLKQLPEAEFDASQLPSVAKARVEEQNARSRLNRLRELSKRQVLTGEELETAETNFTVATVNSRQALLDAQALLATVRHRQAALNTALQKLADAEVVVPGSNRHAGQSDVSQEYVVADRTVAVGEMISTMSGNDPGIFKLVIDNPLKLVTTLPERHRAEIKLGQNVDLHVEYYPDVKFPGTVARINPVVDRTSRTFEVEITVPNDDFRLSPGSFVRATISTNIEDQAPTIPEQALVKMAGVTKVFVIQEGTVREVQVTSHGRVSVPGARYSETWIEIEGDLPLKSMVATSGLSHLSDGSLVRIRSAGDVAAREQEPHP